MTLTFFHEDQLLSSIMEISLVTSLAITSNIVEGNPSSINCYDIFKGQLGRIIHLSLQLVTKKWKLWLKQIYKRISNQTNQFVKRQITWQINNCLSVMLSGIFCISWEFRLCLEITLYYNEKNHFCIISFTSLRKPYLGSTSYYIQRWENLLLARQTIINQTLWSRIFRLLTLVFQVASKRFLF